MPKFSPQALIRSEAGLRAIVARREKREMDRVLIIVSVFAALLLFVSAKKSSDVTDLQIGVKYKPETCSIQSHKGDRVEVHYRGMLINGNIFDSSYERGDPIEFELGKGQVIKEMGVPCLEALTNMGSKWGIDVRTFLHCKDASPVISAMTSCTGWDQGLLGMCVGEKRKLKIPSKLGYGAQGSPPKIPGGATLIFDTELVAVNGKTSSTNQSTEGNEEL